MATRKPDEKNIAHAETASASPSAEPQPIDVQLIEQQNEQIAELKSLVYNLGEQLTAIQAVSARDAEFKAAVRSVETAAASVQRSIIPPVAVTETAYKPQPGATTERDCGCGGGPCDCVSCDCCTFEIWMSHVRVDQMQNPIIDLIPPSADSNILPTGMMEVWMFASIDPVHNIGVCIPDPSPTSYLPLHKQITDAYGPWAQVNRCVGSVTVKKGAPMTVTVALTAVEREDALERGQPFNRDEWGTGTGEVTLDCCYSNYSSFDVPVSLTSWGQAGGAITGRFIVVKSC